MSEPLAVRLGMGDRELVALVGGGGKSTLLFGLGVELAAGGARVLLTTTTKLGADQPARAAAVCRTAAPEELRRRLDGPGPVMWLAADDGHKVTGFPPEVVDAVYRSGVADHVIVEADGSRRRPLKVPGPHEPVIPEAATLVVVVMGLDAVGRPLGESAHRVERAAALTGLGEGDELTAEACATVLAHPEGGLRRVPPRARVAVALTKSRPGRRAEAAAAIGERLQASSRIAAVVVVAETPLS